MPKAKPQRLSLRPEPQADLQIKQAREELRAEVASLAVKGAEQILKREIDAKAHADLLNKISAEL